MVRVSLLVILAVMLLLGVVGSSFAQPGPVVPQPPAPEVHSSGGFFAGFIGPFRVVYVSVKGLFAGYGGTSFHNAWAETWGRGSTPYRAGFVFGCLVILGILGGNHQETQGRKKRAAAPPAPPAEPTAPSP